MSVAGAAVSVSARFEELRSRGECALIPFITAGDPDLETTAEALRVLDRNGADLIELGVPYAESTGGWADDSGGGNAIA